MAAVAKATLLPSKIMFSYARTSVRLSKCTRAELLHATSRSFQFRISRTLSTDKGQLLELESDKDPKSDQVNSKYYVSRKFIPMTRRALVRRILEDESLVPMTERNRFQEFSAALDKRIATTFHGVLGELKALYDPLNPDKETLIVKSYSNEEREESEFWLLEKLSNLLDKAQFYELPAEAIGEALKEHDSNHGVLVSVDPKKYDVLRMWAIGKEVEPLDFGPWYTKLFMVVYNWIFPSPKIQRYKRVVAAIRHEKQQKLLLKGFKDIRCTNLEHLLPEGKIRMTQFDQRVLVGMLGIGMASIVIKLVSVLADYKFSWTYIATAVTGFVALRAWTMYKNKRNSYLVDLSRTLYFKSIANNRALLTLVVDRAEDEVFKATLLAYSFLQASSRLSLPGDESPTNDQFSGGMTADYLKEQVDEWMKSSCQVEMNFDPTEPLTQLENLGLLEKEKKGNEYIMNVIPILDAMQIIPSPHSPADLSQDRMEELDIDMAPVVTEEEQQQKDEKKRDELEEKRLSWH